MSGQAGPMNNSGAAFSSDGFSPSKSSAKTHDFTGFQCGIDYYFEFTSPNVRASMTGQGRGIKPNDYILLQPGSTPQRYQVEIIDYYSNPSDMWIASLKLIP